MFNAITSSRSLPVWALAASSVVVMLAFQNPTFAENAKQLADSAKQLSTGPALDFRDTVSGNPLDFTGLEEKETPEVVSFKATGVNPYDKDAEAIKRGGVIFSTACAGCHGHLAEGKLGPSLADDYWTYPKNETDKGIFETVFGGANGMMGPQRGLLTQDEILHVISWLRALERGDIKTEHH